MKIFVLGCLALLAGAQLPAAIIGAGTPIPSTHYITFGGLDWVYAGPIAPGEFGPGSIELPSFRAAEGWRFATGAEWANRPAWTDFIIAPATVAADFTPVPNGYSDHSKYAFASEYWSNFTHVDIGDAASGNITNGLDIGCLSCVYETWYVRDAGGGQIPEPSTLGLLACGLAALGLRARSLRRQ